MVDSIQFTRVGWIKHLATMQKALELVGTLHGSAQRFFCDADCEKDRCDKIAKELVKLEELIWEAGAVSEKIQRERRDQGFDDPTYDANERDMMNETAENGRRKFHKAAKDLEELMRGLWDKKAPEVVTPEAVYPGETEAPRADADPRQRLLGLTPGNAGHEGPATQDGEGDGAEGEAEHGPDFKERQANDDTKRKDGAENA